MLEKIREGSQGITAKVILGLVILTFALAGLGSYTNSVDTSVAEVNGVKVSKSEFDKAYQAQRNRMAQQYGDSEKTCQELETELVFIQQEMQRIVPDTDNVAANVSVGVAGVFVNVPLFFKDLSKVKQIETKAYRKRHNNLMIIADDKRCDIKGLVIPELKG